MCVLSVIVCIHQKEAERERENAEGRVARGERWKAHPLLSPRDETEVLIQKHWRYRRQMTGS